jgi:2,4-dienoyl-CoA reductase (NADPH2)
MPRKARFEKLLEPCQIGRVKTRNRILKTAALNEFTLEQNKPFFEALARGGVGIIHIGSFDVEPMNRHFQLHAGDDKSIPGLAELTKVIHKYGCPTFLTLLHHGYTTHSWAEGYEAVSSSALALDGMGNPQPVPPRALTLAEVEETVDEFAKAAERAAKAGFDGVEISGATDHLINSFLSRAWNKREDDYGPQSLQSRSRFMVEIVQAIKKRLGQDFPVSVFINGAEYGVAEGTTLEEAQGFARILEKAGADAIQIRAYGYGIYAIPLSPEQLFHPELPKDFKAEGFDASHYGKGALVPLAAAVKKVVSIPVTTVARIDPVMGEQILRDDKADLIGMTRRLIADPELPNKIASGRLDDIVPCTACMGCITTVMSTEEGSRCRINAAMGSKEDYTIKPADKKKKVMVVGGGPAGMEAARVAALRGHDVTLYEKEPKLGGLLPMAALLKGVEIEDIPAIVRYLETQITKLGVKVRLGKEVNLSLIEEIRPDVVILATGRTPVIPEISGINRRKVVSAAELHRKVKAYLRFFGPKTLRWLTKFWMPLGKKVVIIGSDMPGCELAEFLIKRGRKVAIVETAEQLGGGSTEMAVVHILGWLEKKGAVVLTGVKYEEITDKGLTITTREGKRQILEADTIIPALPLTPNTVLLRNLKGKAPEIYSVDVSKPDLIRSAIAEGWRISKTI